MIEAIMFVVLGFLSASLLALMVAPALARRADRLARRRAETAFPLSLAEIAADRDHLRAELALRQRRLEKRAESGFAARAGAMEELGRRDMTIARLERDRDARDQTISGLEADLASTRADLAQTAERLARETREHAATHATLDQRIADLAIIERSLAETRTALTGTGADLTARVTELEDLRMTMARIDALLARREVELEALRAEHDALRLAQVESRTQILVLEGKRDELRDALSESRRGQEETATALAQMTAERDAKAMEGQALVARLGQAEAGLAAADALATQLRARAAGAGASAQAGDFLELRQEVTAIAEALMLRADSRQAAE